MNIMKTKRILKLPKAKEVLSSLGENIKLARLRRKLSLEQVGERSQLSRGTLYKIEKGDPTVGLGSYLSVLIVLGLEKDLAKVASDDQLGRKLQDAGLKPTQRAPKRD